MDFLRRRKINTILDLYKIEKFYNESWASLARQGDVITICDIATDFARNKMYETAVLCWEYLVDYYPIGNVTEAYVNLGVSYYYGNGVELDYKKAVHYYSLAAEIGHPFGEYNLAVACEYGKGHPKDMEKAIFYYNKAAKKGVNMAIDALIRLGLYNEWQLPHHPRRFYDDSFSPEEELF